MSTRIKRKAMMKRGRHGGKAFAVFAAAMAGLLPPEMLLVLQEEPIWTGQKRGVNPWKRIAGRA